jgi:transcriptional regulator GlxA family with amidase domain
MPRRPVISDQPKRGESRPRRVVVLILPDVHLLDLSGPVQAFHEANGFGGGYRLIYCGAGRRIRSAQGLTLADLHALPEPRADDLVLVPGIESSTLGRLDHVPVDWLRAAHRAGARLASVCSGAFALAHAGLLDRRSCTTHWKVVDLLQRRHPAARVLRNRLFVRDGGIVTSAGVASGIDMALALLEEDHGPLLVGRVAREMVVYLRRTGEGEQLSALLDHRTHLHEGIHRVQDWLIAHPETKPTLHELARRAAMSPRNLTRHFRQATGTTLKTFATGVRLRIAGDLLHDPERSIESVASACGFKDARQLRRLWRRTFATTPRAWRRANPPASHTPSPR